MSHQVEYETVISGRDYICLIPDVRRNPPPTFLHGSATVPPGSQSLKQQVIDLLQAQALTAREIQAYTHADLTRIASVLTKLRRTHGLQSTVLPSPFGRPAHRYRLEGAK